MTKLQMLKHAAFIILVPSVVVGGYYGFKYLKKKYDDRKLASSTGQDYSKSDFYRISYDFDYSMPSKLTEALSKTSFSPLSEKVIFNPDGKKITVNEGAIAMDKVDELKEELNIFGDKVTLTKFDLKDSLTLSPDEIKNVQDSK